MEQVKKLIEKLGVSKKDFARLLGVEPITIHRWETGKSTPSGSAKMLLDALSAVHGLSNGVTAAATLWKVTPCLAALVGEKTVNSWMTEQIRRNKL